MPNSLVDIYTHSTDLRRTLRQSIRNDDPLLVSDVMFRASFLDSMLYNVQIRIHTDLKDLMNLLHTQQQEIFHPLLTELEVWL